MPTTTHAHTRRRSAACGRRSSCAAGLTETGSLLFPFPSTPQAPLSATSPMDTAGEDRRQELRFPELLGQGRSTSNRRCLHHRRTQSRL